MKKFLVDSQQVYDMVEGRGDKKILKICTKTVKNFETELIIMKKKQWIKLTAGKTAGNYNNTLYTIYLHTIPMCISFWRYLWYLMLFTTEYGVKGLAG